MNNNPELLIRFFPVLSYGWLVLLATIAVSLIAYAAVKNARGWWWRAGILGLLFLMLLNPSLVEEIREIKPDTALVVVDQSSSNQINGRDRETDEILQAVQEKLNALPNIRYRVISVGDNADDSGGTMLFSALAKSTGDIPKNHLAGIIMITDGQVHDVPVGKDTASVPVQVLLTGKPNEQDRRIKIVRSPGFGIVNQPQKITVHIEDDANNGGSVNIGIRYDGNVLANQMVTIGQDVDIPVTIAHAGSNIFELSVAKGDHELTDENNHAVVTINGVRDRLRVLLISGDPHPGTRVWRNFLKSDPAVDLVHFTILRPPEKQDSVPTDELSLIAFPTKELFEDKLHDFNLIIFDRYRRLSILPNEYMQNIVAFVEKGGAILDAEGPIPEGSLSLFDTPVGPILPTITNQKAIEGEFVAHPSKEGLRHPVIAGLPGLSSDGQKNKWGPWYRQMDAQLRHGNVLLEGLNNKPILVMDRVGQGRVAQLFSDQIWLWARGLEGGGPHSELLRRVSHWLMKEPQLEENDLRAEVQGHNIVITQRSLTQTANSVIIDKPGQETEQVNLTEESPGLARAKYHAPKTGLYRISNGSQSVMIGIGGLNPLEYADLRSSKDKLSGIVESSGGSIRWVSQDGAPDIRHLDANRNMAGRSWIGLRQNNNYSVTGVKQTPLIPDIVYLLLALSFLFLAWRQEGGA